MFLGTSLVRVGTTRKSIMEEYAPEATIAATPISDTAVVQLSRSGRLALTGSYDSVDLHPDTVQTLLQMQQAAASLEQVHVLQQVVETLTVIKMALLARVPSIYDQFISASREEITQVLADHLAAGVPNEAAT